MLTPGGAWLAAGAAELDEVVLELVVASAIAAPPIAAAATAAPVTRIDLRFGMSLLRVGCEDEVDRGSTP
jgi:hypothetical protein